MQQVEDTNFVQTTRSCGSKLSDENEKSRPPSGEMSFQGPSAIPTRDTSDQVLYLQKSYKAHVKKDCCDKRALPCLGQGISVKSASSRERLRALERNNTVIQKNPR